MAEQHRTPAGPRPAANLDPAEPRPADHPIQQYLEKDNTVPDVPRRHAEKTVGQKGEVTEASIESFPASDPPAWTPERS